MSFIRNSWYMAAWSHDVVDKPVSMTLLNDPLVIFRGDHGSVGALFDVCPHRAVPLSLGSVRGGNIVCPYHGIELDTAGICRKNPHVQGAPERLKGRAYPVTEMHGMIWVWMGDAALADTDLIPDYSWFNSPETFTTVRGYTHVEADYRLVIDNLMDLAHADYVHPGTVGQPGAAEVQQASVVRDSDSISVNTIWPNLPPSALHKQAWTRTDKVDKYLDMKWRPSSNLFLDLGVMAPGDTRESGIRTPGAHILTPESECTTHYFWCTARDFDLDNEDLSQRIFEIVGRAFNQEDKPIIEATQRNMVKTGARFTNFTKGDAGSAMVRREIERRVAQEQTVAEKKDVAVAAPAVNGAVAGRRSADL